MGSRQPEGWENWESEQWDRKSKTKPKHENKETPGQNHDNSTMFLKEMCFLLCYGGSYSKATFQLKIRAKCFWMILCSQAVAFLWPWGSNLWLCMTDSRVQDGSLMCKNMYTAAVRDNGLWSFCGCKCNSHSITLWTSTIRIWWGLYTPSLHMPDKGRYVQQMPPVQDKCWYGPVCHDRWLLLSTVLLSWYHYLQGLLRLVYCSN